MLFKRLSKLIVCFLFLTLQTSLESAEECLDFEESIIKKNDFSYPAEYRDDIGIFFDYEWDVETESIIIKRNNENYPIVRVSLFDKSINGNSIRTFDGVDLSKIDDVNIKKLEKLKKAVLEIDGSQSKITIESSKYRFMAYDLFAFYINSINEINTREGFFKMDYAYHFDQVRSDLQEEGKILKDIECSINEEAAGKLFYPVNEIYFYQIEADQDKLEYEDYFYHHKGLTVLTSSTYGVSKIRSDFDFTYFPFDKQKLLIKFDTNENITTDPDAVGWEDNLPQVSLFYPKKNVFMELENYKMNNFLKEWTIEKIKIYSTLNVKRSYYTKDNVLVDAPSDVLNIEILIERNFYYFIYKIIIPVFLILLVAWSVLWIPTVQIESRLTTSIVSLLALIAYNFVFHDDIPQLNYLTSLDQYILLSYSYCIIPILMTIVFSGYVARGKQKLASRVNRIFRTWGVLIYFLIAFQIFNQ